jgi:hypothetical protein
MEPYHHLGFKNGNISAEKCSLFVPPKSDSKSSQKHRIEIAMLATSPMTTDNTACIRRAATSWPEEISANSGMSPPQNQPVWTPPMLSWMESL